MLRTATASDKEQCQRSASRRLYAAAVARLYLKTKQSLINKNPHFDVTAREQGITSTTQHGQP